MSPIEGRDNESYVFDRFGFCMKRVTPIQTRFEGTNQRSLDVARGQPFRLVRGIDAVESR
jgi:hypothetical protein